MASGGGRNGLRHGRAHADKQEGRDDAQLHFPREPAEHAHRRQAVADRDAGFAALGVVAPDYIVPSPFLFPDGGTIAYAGIDALNYPPLPGGVDSLGRAGALVLNSPTNYLGQTGSIGPAAPAVATGVPALGNPPLAIVALLLALAALSRRDGPKGS